MKDPLKLHAHDLHMEADNAQEPNQQNKKEYQAAEITTTMVDLVCENSNIHIYVNLFMFSCYLTRLT